MTGIQYLISGIQTNIDMTHFQNALTRSGVDSVVEYKNVCEDVEHKVNIGNNI